MPTSPRISLSSYSRISQFQLSSQRRAALHNNLRKAESASALPGSGQSLWPGLSLHVWMPLLLLPVILVILVVHSVIRVLGSALRWIVIWCGGFLAGGLLGWIVNALIGAGYSAAVVVAAGGFLGLVVLSALYGMCLEWVFWVSRHENNPYAGAVSLSPEQQAARVAFAKSLHWPTALASACGGFLFAVLLFPIVAGTESAWPSFLWWALWGAAGLSVQGFLLGVFLGWKRNRVVYDASKHSLGEFVGWQLAGPKRGLKPALGWGLGYALHQLPAGAIAGLVLGGITQLFLS
jgi:hypothetical protein